MTDCPHPSFMSTVNVNRITDGEGGPVTAYYAEMHINCTVCGVSFLFRCPDMGMLSDRPTISIDATEIRLPVAPANNPDMKVEYGFVIKGATQVKHPA